MLHSCITRTIQMYDSDALPYTDMHCNPCYFHRVLPSHSLSLLFSFFSFSFSPLSFGLNLFLYPLLLPPPPPSPPLPSPSPPPPTPPRCDDNCRYFAPDCRCYQDERRIEQVALRLHPYLDREMVCTADADAPVHAHASWLCYGICYSTRPSALSALSALSASSYLFSIIIIVLFLCR